MITVLAKYRKLVVVCTTTVLFILLILLIVSIRASLEKSSTTGMNDRTISSPIGAYSSQTVLSTDSESLNMDLDVVSLNELVQFCPEPFSHDEGAELSAQCLAMLESFFMQEPYVPPDGGYAWLELPMRMAYSRIFDNPVQDHAIALDALLRRECRFEEDTGVRTDLIRTCHAESFSAVAWFWQICTQGEDGLGDPLGENIGSWWIDLDGLVPRKQWDQDILA